MEWRHLRAGGDSFWEENPVCISNEPVGIPKGLSWKHRQLGLGSFFA